MKRIFLIGPRACGKTTVGKMLAKTLDCPFYDTDELLLDRLGTSIASVVSLEGWDGFRRREHTVLKDLVDDTERGEGACVVSTGGGIVLLKENRRLLREHGTVIYLDVSVEELTRRLSAAPNAAQRPSLTGKSLTEEVGEVLSQRRPLYIETATCVLTGEKAPQDLCGLIAEALPQ